MAAQCSHTQLAFFCPRSRLQTLKAGAGARIRDISLQELQCWLQIPGIISKTVQIWVETNKQRVLINTKTNGSWELSHFLLISASTIMLYKYLTSQINRNTCETDWLTPDWRSLVISSSRSTCVVPATSLSVCLANSTAKLGTGATIGWRVDYWKQCPGTLSW